MGRSEPELIAGLYSNMSAENILVFHGAQEAIFGYMNVARARRPYDFDVS